MNNYNAVILDETSFNADDLDLTKLLSLTDHWQRYDTTTKEQRLERLTGKHIVIANKFQFDEALLSQLPDLKVILLTATGMDNIDLAYCEKHQINTYNVRDYCTPGLSQHVFTLMLALTTNLNAYQKMTRNGEWSKSDHFSDLQYPIYELQNKTIGLMGYGSLAKGVEKIAEVFGMKVLIAARVGSETAPEGRVLIDDLLPQVDFLSVHCPLTPDTHEVINYDFIKKMKSSAFLINTARGAVVNNKELAQALSDGIIAGAGIDVLEQEPPPADHPLLSPDIPNLILTPHIAWASIEARQRMIEKVTDNLKDWFSKQ